MQRRNSKFTPIAFFKKMQCTVFELHLVRYNAETQNLLQLHLLNIAQCASFKNRSVYVYFGSETYSAPGSSSVRHTSHRLAQIT